MSYITEYKQKFEELTQILDNRDQLSLKSNGGNSIIFSYPPEEEILYINEARKRYKDKARFIDISQLLVSFIDDDGWEGFSDYYKTMVSSPHKVFFDKDAKEVDLFNMIIERIKEACSENKLPFLIRTGCLYGTGIENVNIMEDKAVMNMSLPLVIFYPSKIVDGNILFLNFKPASNYRSILIK